MLRKMHTYEYPAHRLAVGASLGNPKAWVNTKVTGAVEGFFSCELGMAVAGSLLLRYADRGHHPDGERRSTVLDEEGEAVFLFHPAYQRRRVELVGGLTAEEIIFLPRTGGSDPAACYLMVRLTNGSDAPRRLLLQAWAGLRGDTQADVIARWEAEEGCLLAHNESFPHWVRLFAALPWATAWCVTADESRAYDAVGMDFLPQRVEGTGDVLGVLQQEVDLPPGGGWEGAYLLAFTPAGEEAALEILRRGREFAAAFAATVRYHEERLALAGVATPDAVINQGTFWAKANMLRVLAEYPQGLAFTNEPGVSSNVVARDVVWFTHGCDCFLPHVSRRLLLSLGRLQEENGKIVEYYDARTGQTADYGLNINDDTPLFILGVLHHFAATADRDFLHESYPAVAKAARYLVSQEDERGLVYCVAAGEEVWGIAGWRNVIPHHRINGAVTEVNAECYAALRAAYKLAQAAGHAEDAAWFREQAARLKRAINRHLLNPENGMYYLNIDDRGVAHPDVTGDEVFPVMFNVSSPEVGSRIVARLNSPDFWTEAGIRTVSRRSPQYRPRGVRRGGSGLLGGVWPGLTFWYAFAAARHHPEFMARALHNSYRQYVSDPRGKNTVPGEYSEWFDGEALINCGMRLSPWEPPRYLWAALEGMAGLHVVEEAEGDCLLDPALPPAWKWLAVRRLPLRGREVSFCVVRQGKKLRVHATCPFKTVLPQEHWGRDATDRVECLHEAVEPLAFSREGEHLIFLGNTAQAAVTAPVDLSRLLADDPYELSVYDSETDRWETAAGLSCPAVRIEGGGFRLLGCRRRA
ncbi:MAG: hypothetical protein M0Z27_12670 [Thermaerobacter sp.]|nr:hypothetical protein [Thermaerobacter sp.]